MTYDAKERAATWAEGYELGKRDGYADAKGWARKFRMNPYLGKADQPAATETTHAACGLCNGLHGLMAPCPKAETACPECAPREQTPRYTNADEMAGLEPQGAPRIDMRAELRAIATDPEPPAIAAYGEREIRRAEFRAFAESVSPPDVSVLAAPQGAPRCSGEGCRRAARNDGTGLCHVHSGWEPPR